jgi:curved DNA-binding protein CbpA
MIDPYATLGLTPAATLAQVRAAYRRAAMRHHPDRDGGNLAKFPEAKAAYELLTDPDKAREPFVPAQSVSGMTLDYINLRAQYPDIDGVCSTCGGGGKVNVAVGKIGWRSMPCPKCSSKKE